MNSPEVRRRYAVALLNADGPGDAGKARDLLQELLKNDPKETRVLYLLVQAQRQLNEYQAAEAAARRLIAADPGGASGPYALAQVYEQRHEYRKVVETLEPVVERLGEMAARVCARLGARGLAADGFEWVCRLAAGHAHEGALTPAVPLTEATAVTGLLRLALEARPPRGIVLGLTLRARPVSQKNSAAVMLEVVDTGKGIPPEVERRIFDPFYSTKEGGTGLGLAIAARIAEKHGGLLKYESQLNRGTTFRLLLPQAKTNESKDSAGRR